MSVETISYSTSGKGWNSRHSFVPDCMIGLNSSLYTWKDGSLYLHHSNELRNNYYGVSYPSTITSVFNNNPYENKVFKTIALDGNKPWKADVRTDYTNGVVESTYFKEKEGVWYGYIRREDDTIDLKAISTQGIGIGAYSALTFTFTFNFNASISIGDKVYVTSDPSTVGLQLVGTIVSYTGTTITVDSEAFTPNPAGDFVAVVKNSSAESYGSRGSWMEVKLTNEDSDPVELFTISSDAMKSYP